MDCVCLSFVGCCSRFCPLFVASRRSLVSMVRLCCTIHPSFCIWGIFSPARHTLPRSAACRPLFSAPRSHLPSQLIKIVQIPFGFWKRSINIKTPFFLSVCHFLPARVGSLAIRLLALQTATRLSHARITCYGALLTIFGRSRFCRLLCIMLRHFIHCHSRSICMGKSIVNRSWLTE